MVLDIQDVWLDPCSPLDLTGSKYAWFLAAHSLCHAIYCANRATILLMLSGAAAKILPWLGKFLESSRNGLLLSMYIQFEGWILAIMTFFCATGACPNRCLSCSVKHFSQPGSWTRCRVYLVSHWEVYLWSHCRFLFQSILTMHLPQEPRRVVDFLVRIRHCVLEWLLPESNQIQKYFIDSFQLEDCDHDGPHGVSQNRIPIRVLTVWKSLNRFANLGKPNRIRLPDLGSWQEFDSAWHHRMRTVGTV